MMKFRCQKCGHRIAVPPRMVNRVVNCPECGSATHPLAEQLVGGPPPAEVEAHAVTTKAVAAHQVRHCDNCGRLIGRLEESHVWRGAVVCVTCHVHLAPVVKTGAGASQPKTERVKAAEPAKEITAAPKQHVEARRVAASESLPTVRAPSRMNAVLATKPVRVLLALMCVALAIYFIYAFLQVIGLLANVLIVAALLVVALYFLFRSAPPARDATALPSRRE